jgi:hypothetical protein
VVVSRYISITKLGMPPCTGASNGKQTATDKYGAQGNAEEEAGTLVRLAAKDGRAIS